MEQPEERATVAAPVSALAKAGGAAVFLGVGEAIGLLSEAAEDVFILTAFGGVPSVRCPTWKLR